MKIKYEQCVYNIALNETGGKTKGQGTQSLGTYVRKIVKLKSELETLKAEAFLKIFINMLQSSCFCNLPIPKLRIVPSFVNVVLITGLILILIIP